MILLDGHLAPLLWKAIIGIHKALYKVEEHIPAQISDVPSWDAEIKFLKIWSVPQSWCKSNYEKIKIF